MTSELDILTARHACSIQNELNNATLDVGDPALAARGVQQARQFSNYVVQCGIEYIVCAENLRCWQTAMLATQGTDIPVYRDGRLGEINWGDDAGRLRSEVFSPAVDARAEAEGAHFRLNPNAETIAEVHDRFLAVVQEHQGIRNLIISSGFTISAYFGYEWELPRSEIRKNLKVGNTQTVGYGRTAAQPLTTYYTAAA